MRRWFPLLVVFVCLAPACGSDSDPEGPEGSGGGARAGSGGESGAGQEPSAGGETGLGGSGDAGGGGSSGGGAGGEAGSPGQAAGGAGGAPSGGEDFGELEGRPFEAFGSNALFVEVPDRGYVSISIMGWEETCDVNFVECDKPQINFTLYAIGGTLADLVPGTYEVGEVDTGDVTFEIVGGAGWYAPDCSSGDGFDDLASGTLTLTSLTGGRVEGSVDFTLDTGDQLSGSFDAIDCTE